VELIDGQEAHHLSVIEHRLAREIWVAVDNEPVVRQMSIDLTEAIAKAEAPFQHKVGALSVVHQYKNWRFNVKPSIDLFRIGDPLPETRIERIESERRRMLDKQDPGHRHPRGRIKGRINGGVSRNLTFRKS
jgi:hypothetical protein